ncbi:hypothetical protein JR316_0012345 [Psilocybe cubensis]|uniref:Uncharacterized protein n=2 Tax=Psilocybe cubensis TaxID=181762 RepID=A0ACB8GJI8_PSICU|nr:hypothetical protein JR316_0012345 [Psilocybe cubensis]KAH9475234.1 hypothetical protein JR316_0012345 [Psilocybe cubensis]
MEDPIKEITSVVYQLTATDSPNVQKSAVETYMTSDVGFQHPVCSIKPGPNSRDYVLGIYQWYRVLSPHIEIKVESIVFDAKQCLLYLEGIQWFKMFFLPIKPAPARLIIRLTLRKKDGLYYISQQEDFYHPEDFAALLVPVTAPFVRFGLTVGGVVSNILARGANMLGYWRPIGDVEEPGIPSVAPSESGLYDKED